MACRPMRRAQVRQQRRTALRYPCALRAAAVPAELLCIAGAGHGPDFPGALDPPDFLGAMV